MTKHLVDIDPDLLRRARSAAGTETIKATVEAGLRKLADAASGLEYLRSLRKHPLNRDAAARARAPRQGPRG